MAVIKHSSQKARCQSMCLIRQRELMGLPPGRRQGALSRHRIPGELDGKDRAKAALTPNQRR